jgi:hypothetical protein
MISAGEQVKWTKDQQRDFICGGHFVKAQEETANSATATADEKEMAQAQAQWLEVNAVDSTCEARFEELWDKYSDGLNGSQYSVFEDEAGWFGAYAIYQRCQNQSVYMFDKSLESAPALAHCTSNFLNPDQLPFTATFEELEGEPTLDLPEFPTDLSYHHKDVAGYEQVLIHARLAALDLIDKAGITSEGIEMPQSLKDFIEELKNAGLPEHAQLAHDLFYQGVGLTKPSGEMVKAAQPIADDVQDYVRTKAGKPLSDYVMADDADKPGIAATNDAKDFPEIEYIFVSKTGPKPDYKVDIKEAPKAIKDYFKDFPPPVRREALRLYGEALEKAGKDAKDEDVAKLLVDKIKEVEKKLGGDKDKLADKLMHLRVDKVEMPNKMILKEIDFPGAPADLHERVGTEGSNTKKWIINGIWNQARAKLKEQGIETMDLKLMGKIVDDLATQLKGMSIKKMASQKVVAVNKTTGKVALQEIPEEIQDILYYPVDLLPLHLGQEGAGMVIFQTSYLYQAYDPTLKDEKIATKVAEAAERYLDPKKNEWTDDGKKAVSKYLLTEPNGYYNNGDVKLKDPPSGNGGGFVDGTPEDGMHIVAVTASAEGGVVSADDPAFAGYAGVDFLYEYYKAKAGGFRLGIGIDGGGMPGVLVNGEPRGEMNVGDSLSGDQALWARFNRLSVGYFYNWDKEGGMDGEFALNGGLLSGRFNDGTGLGLNSLSAPMSHYQFFTAGGSTMYGIDPSITLNSDNDIVELAFKVILGTAQSYFLYDKTGGAIDANGGRAGASAKVSADWGSEQEKFEALGIAAEIGYQQAFAGVDANAFTVGGSFGLLHDNGFDFGVGVGFGLHGDETEKNAYRMVVGGHLGYNHALKKNEDVTFLAGLGINFLRHWQDKRVDVDNNSTGVGDTEDCDDGYDCDSDADVGDNGGTVSSTDNLSNFITGGNNIVEFSPYLGFNFKVSEADSIDLTLKVPIWYMDNIQANDVKETNWGVMLGFGYNFDSSKLLK